jgi:hypothetical protein
MRTEKDEEAWRGALRKMCGVEGVDWDKARAAAVALAWIKSVREIGGWAVWCVWVGMLALAVVAPSASWVAQTGSVGGKADGVEMALLGTFGVGALGLCAAAIFKMGELARYQFDDALGLAFEGSVWASGLASGLWGWSQGVVGVAVFDALPSWPWWALGFFGPWAATAALNSALDAWLGDAVKAWMSQVWTSWRAVLGVHGADVEKVLNYRERYVFFEQKSLEHCLIANARADLVVAKARWKSAHAALEWVERRVQQGKAKAPPLSLNDCSTEGLEAWCKKWCPRALDAARAACERVALEEQAAEGLASGRGRSNRL